jgi:hypothetical protein
LFAFFLCCSAAVAGLVNTPPASVTTYRVYELALSAGSPAGNPYVDGPSVTVTFSGTSGAAKGQVLVVKGFWDGGNTWRVRFAPPAVGTWSWITTSTDAGLNAVSGSVSAVAPTSAEVGANELYHGFLQQDGYAWKLSDNTPFLPVGDTHWSFSEEFTTAEWQTWMNARQAQHYNTFLGCIWLAIYTRSGVPVAFPSGNPQTDTPNMAYFQQLDQMVQYANDHGIMMGLTIGGFPGNSSWWARFATRAREDRWFRYCVARYTAYNVRWCLYGEVNEANPSWGTWQAEVAYKAQLVRDEDPYDHPIGSHHTTVDTSSAGNGNIGFVEVQIDTCGARTETQYQRALTYRSYNKPVWFEEYWYECTTCDNEYVVGMRNTYRSFVAAMAFPTMASLMRNHFNQSPPPDVSQAASDPGAIRMGYFHEFFKSLDMRNFSPATALVSAGQCGKFGDHYAIFKQGGGSLTLNLAGVAGTFSVTILDINTGVAAGLGSLSGGAVRTINTGTSADVAILVMKEGPATNTAPSVSAGLDQTIRFGQTLSVDGTVSDDGLPNPPSVATTGWSQVSGPGTVSFASPASADTTATFSAMGVYVLRLTASDGELSASDDTTITVNTNIPGDGDNDGDVDMDDFALFQLCMTGSGEWQTETVCAFADLQHDGDVDGADVDLFVSCMSGAGIPGNPNCVG